MAVFKWDFYLVRFTNLESLVNERCKLPCQAIGSNTKMKPKICVSFVFSHDNQYYVKDKVLNPTMWFLICYWAHEARYYNIYSFAKRSFLLHFVIELLGKLISVINLRVPFNRFYWYS